MPITEGEVRAREAFALTTAEVAKMLNIHPNTVKRAGDRGLLEFFRIGTRGDRRYLPSSIEEYINTSTSRSHLR